MKQDKNNLQNNNNYFEDYINKIKILCTLKNIKFVDYTNNLEPTPTPKQHGKFNTYIFLENEVNKPQNKKTIYLINISKLESINPFLYKLQYDFYKLAVLNETNFKKCFILYGFYNVMLISNDINETDIENKLEMFLSSPCDKVDPDYYEKDTLHKIKVLGVTP
jgi:hypothetical protein